MTEPVPDSRLRETDADPEFERLVALGMDEAKATEKWLSGTASIKLTPFALRGLAHSFGLLLDRRSSADGVKPGWRPIETAPSGKVVLLWKPNTKEQYVAARIDGGHGPGWCTPDGFEIFNATHWQELPEPPALDLGGTS